MTTTQPEQADPLEVTHLPRGNAEHRDFHVHNVHIDPRVVDAHLHTQGDRLVLHEDPRHGGRCEGRVRVFVSGFPGPHRVRFTTPSGRQWEVPIQDGGDRSILAGSTVTELGSHKAELLAEDGTVEWTHYFMVGEGLDDLYRPEHPRSHAHPDDYDQNAGSDPNTGQPLRRAHPDELRA